jgi:hypothetical protein
MNQATTAINTTTSTENCSQSTPSNKINKSKEEGAKIMISQELIMAKTIELSSPLAINTTFFTIPTTNRQ